MIRARVVADSILRRDPHARMHRTIATVPHSCITATVSLLSNLCPAIRQPISHHPIQHAQVQMHMRIHAHAKAVNLKHPPIRDAFAVLVLTPAVAR